MAAKCTDPSRQNIPGRRWSSAAKLVQLGCVATLGPVLFVRGFQGLQSHLKEFARVRVGRQAGQELLPLLRVDGASQKAGYLVMCQSRTGDVSGHSLARLDSPQSNAKTMPRPRRRPASRQDSCLAGWRKTMVDEDWSVHIITI